jgi:hypothetical protein
MASHSDPIYKKKGKTFKEKIILYKTNGDTTLDNNL